MFDAVLDVDLDPHLVNADRHEAEFPHAYVEKWFESCDLKYFVAAVVDPLHIHMHLQLKDRTESQTNLSHS